MPNTILLMPFRNMAVLSHALTKADITPRRSSTACAHCSPRGRRHFRSPALPPQALPPAQPPHDDGERMSAWRSEHLMLKGLQKRNGNNCQQCRVLAARRMGARPSLPEVMAGVASGLAIRPLPCAGPRHRADRGIVSPAALPCSSTPSTAWVVTGHSASAHLDLGPHSGQAAPQLWIEVSQHLQPGEHARRGKDRRFGADLRLDVSHRGGVGVAGAN